MCGWEIAAYAAAVAAAAYGANQQAEAANEAADRQAAALNAALLQQDEWSKRAEKTAVENADQYDQTKRTNRLEEAMTNAGDTLTQSLVKSREDIGLPDQASGKISSEFTADRSNKMADQFQKSVDMARLMGRMRGVQDMLGNEAITNADYASKLNTIGRNAQGSYNAAQPGITAAGKVDSGKVTQGAVLQALGTSYLANGLMGGGGGAGGSSASGLGAGYDIGSGMGNAMGSGTGQSAGGIGLGYDLGSGVSNSGGSMFGNGTPMFGYGKPF